MKMEGGERLVSIECVLYTHTLLIRADKMLTTMLHGGIQ